MGAIRGRYIDGKVVLDAPADWPEGTQVVVELVDPVPEGLPDEDVSPDAIAHRLALMDQIEPWMTPEEDARWKQALAEQKAWELAHWEEHARKLENLFE